MLANLNTVALIYSDEFGKAFEHFLIQETRAYLGYYLKDDQGLEGTRAISATCSGLRWAILRSLPRALLIFLMVPFRRKNAVKAEVFTLNLHAGRNVFE